VTLSINHRNISSFLYNMASNVTETTIKNEKVGIVGSGLIGRSWAMLFAAAGYNVCLYDIKHEQVSAALDNILVQLKDLSTQGLLRGSLTVEEQHGLMEGTNSLADCVSEAVYVQECVPEDLSLKTRVFAELDALVSDNTVLASSTSAMPCSTFTEKLNHRKQAIVVHPCNPPFYCPVTEVVPAPWTEESVTSRTLAYMKEIGQVPVHIKKEVKGFVLNRLQYALLYECWRLVEDGAISVEDIDTVMKDGLGMRYAFCGPLETCHLNAEGMRNYCERYGETIYNVSSTFGPVERWGGKAADEVVAGCDAMVPLEDLAERRRWRDKRLSALAKLKKEMD